MTWRSLWQRVRPAWPVVALVVAVVAVAVIVTPEPGTGLPLDPASPGPDGTKALIDVLDEAGRGADVIDPDQLRETDADVILVLRDILTDELRQVLRRQAERGARVVIADPGPGSTLAPEVTGGVGLLPTALDRGCDLAALRDADRVRPVGGVLYAVPDGAVGCFSTDDGAWLLAEQRGRGHVVWLGGGGVLTNRELDRADHAVLAVQLLTPDRSRTIAVVRPMPVAGGGLSPFDLIPDRVRAALLQLLLAFGVFAVWRARRLGPPLVERLPVTLASSELTSAVGALLARHGARPATAERIADDTRRRLARQVDLPAGASVDDVATRVAQRTGWTVGAVRDRLEPQEPGSDAELLRIASDLSDLDHAVRDALSPIPETTDVH